MSQQSNQSEIKCELFDSRKQVLEVCDKSAAWMINFPSFSWVACDEHCEAFKLDAKEKGLGKVVSYEPLTPELTA